MKIETLRYGDNFIYLLRDGDRAAVVDPGNAYPVEEALASCGSKLELILITHHHGDHTGGCHALKRATGCRVVGPPGGSAIIDDPLQDGDNVTLAGIELEVLSVPGHLDHDLSYYAADAKAVFTGDTLFACGCGRLFNGDANTMWASLCRLRDLPGETRVYGGHDYTLDNLQFAAQLEPGNAQLRQRLAAYSDQDALTALPSTIEEERQTNPFFRCDTPELMQALDMQGAAPVAVFAEVRHRKDRW